MFIVPNHCFTNKYSLMLENEINFELRVAQLCDAAF